MHTTLTGLLGVSGDNSALAKGLADVLFHAQQMPRWPPEDTRPVPGPQVI